MHRAEPGLLDPNSTPARSVACVSTATCRSVAGLKPSWRATSYRPRAAGMGLRACGCGYGDEHDPPVAAS